LRLRPKALSRTPRVKSGLEQSEIEEADAFLRGTISTSDTSMAAITYTEYGSAKVRDINRREQNDIGLNKS
jgi:hypothetical protein